ncbi:MAG: bifunctional folylpolyglutamate synthase/dihydrofolate synthase [Clostridia bacterium]|nr:bifunctional folylpolyglutamate synthase/dihydrofolate synthase [Clostridia bacterium]
MTYKQSREYIESLAPRGIVPGLESVTLLLAALGTPQDSLRCIHIAGTNGKGSVGALLESILLADGKSVCRFSSPAVGEHLEMFTYNGIPVNPQLYTDAVTDIRTAISVLEADGVFPTSFEAETAAAFLMFSRLAPDYALIECGMGGKLDATNVISAPAAAVITSVSYDHSAFLGSTTTEIAYNKAGIIKPDTPVISAPQQKDVADVIKKTATECNAQLSFAEVPESIQYQKDKTIFKYKGIEYTIKLLGAYQTQNAALAVDTAITLGISLDAVQTGLSRAWLPFRFERIGRFILDGAHNEGAARMMAISLKIYTRPEATAFICGCFRDKDYKKIAELTAPYANAVYCVKPHTDRGLISSELCRIFAESGAKAYDCGSVTAAIKAANSRGYDNIVVFGSLSILKEAKSTIKSLEVRHGQSK